MYAAGAVRTRDTYCFRKYVLVVGFDVRILELVIIEAAWSLQPGECSIFDSTVSDWAMAARYVSSVIEASSQISLNVLPTNRYFNTSGSLVIRLSFSEGLWEGVKSYMIIGF